MNIKETHLDPKSATMLRYLEKTLAWPKHQYILWGSAILAFLGIKPMNDIDILCTPYLFEKIKKEYKSDYTWYKTGHVRIHFTNHPIEVENIYRFCEESLPGVFNPTRLLERDHHQIHGFKVARLRDIIAYKFSRREWLTNSDKWGPNLEDFHKKIIEQDDASLMLIFNYLKNSNIGI